jgi:hypothetical protein
VIDASGGDPLHPIDNNVWEKDIIPRRQTLLSIGFIYLFNGQRS